jgi:hypothetical protein
MKKSQMLTLFILSTLVISITSPKFSILQDALSSEHANNRRVNPGNPHINDRVEQKKLSGHGLSYADFEHSFLGCPENSICNKETGKQLLALKKFKAKYDYRGALANNRISSFNKFTQKNGLYVKILSKLKSTEVYSPVMWSSHCSLHNPIKDKMIIKEKQIFKSFAFVLGIENDKVLVKSNLKSKISVLKVKQGEQVNLDKVIVLNSKNKIEKKFYIPHGTSPSYLNEDKIISVNNYKDIFYAFEVPVQGRWKIIDPAVTMQTDVKFDKEKTKCPKEISLESLGYNPDFYSSFYCLKIRDLALKKQKTIVMPRACL